VYEALDWGYRGAYIQSKHAVSVPEADEANADIDRLLIEPDYNSKSGKSVRIIGFCQSRNELLTIIAMNLSGVNFGVNAWPSNAKDIALYYGRESHEKH